MAPELVQGRFRARRLAHRYNHHFPEDATPESLLKDQDSMLRELIGNIGEDPFIDPPLHVDYGCNITIGDRFYANFK